VINPRTSVELVSPRLASRASYAYAAVAHAASRLIFTAGACPLDESGAIVDVGDVGGQAERVMTNLRMVLQAAQADLPDVVKSTVDVASQRRSDLLAVY
jgi:enamine deaminase RidA (YjgF/YER057c/UK114 family)